MFVLLITVDALRYDYINMGIYSYAIESLSKTSHVFKNAYATGSITPFSFPSILGFHYRIEQITDEFPTDKPCVAKVFKNYGFETIGMQAANPYLTAYFNYNAGFNEFVDFIPSSKISKQKIISIPEFWKEFQRNFIQKFIIYSKAIFLNQSIDIDASKIISLAIEKLKLFNKDDNLFLWIHFMDTHNPFIPPKKFLPYRSRFKYGRDIIRALKAYSDKSISSMKDLKAIKQLYLACVMNINDNLKRLFLWLKEKEWYDNAIIILTSDHGESFLEHGIIGHPPDSLYNEQLQVPLIVKLPNQKQEEIHYKKVSHIDLFSSILNYLGIRISSDFRGRNTLFSSKHHNYPIFACGGSKFKRRRIVCIKENWKLISLHGPHYAEVLELFNLAEDSNEKINQSKKKQRKALELLKHSVDFYNTFNATKVNKIKAKNNEIERRLKDLGYL